MKPIAIIPARGGSKRIPRKNIVPVGGHPMVAYAIQTAISSQLFEQVIVSTEDEEIEQVARRYGARVIERPREMATDEANETLCYLQVLEQLAEEGVKPDYFCAIYATAILIQPQDLQLAFKQFNKQPSPELIMSVSEYPIHPYKAMAINDSGFLTPVYPEENRLRSQFHPRWVASNGTFYWFNTQDFRREKSYFLEKTTPYLLPPERAVDIDEPKDLRFAEQLLQHKQVSSPTLSELLSTHGA